MPGIMNVMGVEFAVDRRVRVPARARPPSGRLIHHEALAQQRRAVRELLRGGERQRAPTPAKCACSAGKGSDESCETCKAKAQAAKALGVVDPDSESGDFQRPYAGGSATIQCDGSGDYEVVLNGWSGATCGTKACVIKHEESHIKDWKKRWPQGCKNKAKGYLPLGGPGYAAFLKKSECTAHTVDLACANALPKTGACKATVENYIKLTKRQKANYC